MNVCFRHLFFLLPEHTPAPFLGHGREDEYIWLASASLALGVPLLKSQTPFLPECQDFAIWCCCILPIQASPFIEWAECELGRYSRLNRH